MSTAWFPISPAESDVTRLSLDFGLRGAILHFNELIVPGIGGGRFVRQYSWAVAGLAIANEATVGGRRVAHTPLAHGIEALACKAEFVVHDAASPRIFGKRAFARDGEAVSSFAALRQRAHYVQNTFRARLVRALRSDVGLGLAEGQRYETMTLSPTGVELARAFLDEQHVGRGGRVLRGWLVDWVAGTRAVSWGTLADALSPARATKSERTLLRSRLVDVETALGVRRREVAEVLEEDGFTTPVSVVRGLRKRKREEAARDLELAVAFGRLLAAALRLLEELTDNIESDGPRTVEKLAVTLADELDMVKRSGAQYLERLRTAPNGHALADDLARRAVRAAPADLLRHLVTRADRVVTVLDSRIAKGPLFRNLLAERRQGDAQDDEDVDDEQTAQSSAQFRLGRFHELLLDTRGRAP